MNGENACRKEAVLIRWCEHHYRQQARGAVFTTHKPRRPPGSSLNRDEFGRKQCGACLQWFDTELFTKSARTPDGLQSWCTRCTSDWARNKRYGMTARDVEAMVVAQGGCAMCGLIAPLHAGARNGWHVDHDHSCCKGDVSCGSCIRGVLCARCNKLIGIANDDRNLLARAIEFLERTGSHMTEDECHPEPSTAAATAHD